jgi:hypothetical protein
MLLQHTLTILLHNATGEEMIEGEEYLVGRKKPS